MDVMRSTFAVLAAIIISASSAKALESNATAWSPLPPGELWKKVGDFCGLPSWDPAVENCVLSADGKHRTSKFFGGAARTEAELEDWSDANRSFRWKNTSSSSGSVANYHGQVSVTADGQGSVLKWTAGYEANGVPDAQAQSLIDSAIYRTLCVGGPLLCAAPQSSNKAAEIISIEGASVNSTPISLRGHLRRPDATGPFPAVVLLHGCAGGPESLDQNWGPRIAAWGYVTLTVDGFRSRGLKNTCAKGPQPGMEFDAYTALNFLVKQSFVDPKRVFVVGFSQGGLLSLSSVERGPVEQRAENKFLAAVAFYPPCIGVKGPMTVSALILTGESDDWAPAEACRKLVAGQDDLGISRQQDEGKPIQLVVYAGAYHAFDTSTLRRPVRYFGHRIEFNQAATEQSSEALHQFLQSMIENR
jgi:dienelactone hydrolase